MPDEQIARAMVRLYVEIVLPMEQRKGRSLDVSWDLARIERAREPWEVVQAVEGAIAACARRLPPGSQSSDARALLLTIARHVADAWRARGEPHALDYLQRCADGPILVGAHSRGSNDDHSGSTWSRQDQSGRKVWLEILKEVEE